jgi:ATP-dependent DNA helicase RecG
MERRGSGFKKILADYEGQVEFDESKMPVFDADNDDFTLTLYNLNYGTNFATQVNENVIEISKEKIKKLMQSIRRRILLKHVRS